MVLTDDLNKARARAEELEKAGKTSEVESATQEYLNKLNQISTDLVIEVNMGPSHRFATHGFRPENSPRFTGKVKFKVSRMVELGQPAIKGCEMLEVAHNRGCDTTLDEGERIATFFNSPAGRDAYKALKAAGFWYIVLSHKDGIWVFGLTCERYVPILDVVGEQCVPSLIYLGGDCSSVGGLLVPCN